MIETYEGLPFGQTVAKSLLDHHCVLAPGRHQRHEIVACLVEEYLKRGGTKEGVPADPARSVKKIFPKKDTENERFRDVAFGLYEYLGHQDEVGASIAPFSGSSSAIAPDLQRGTGRYEVYAWCLPQDEDADDRWPIKIGYAGAGGFLRRWQQDFATHLPVLPRYLRSFRFETESQARKAERYLGDILGDGRKRRIEGIPGKEWFLTSPNEVDKVVEFMYPNMAPSSGP